jgi:hypothetical protein
MTGRGVEDTKPVRDQGLVAWGNPKCAELNDHDSASGGIPVTFILPFPVPAPGWPPKCLSRLQGFRGRDGTWSRSEEPILIT